MGIVLEIVRKNKRWLLPLWERTQAACLRSAAREQGLSELAGRLEGIVPNLKSQYSTFAVDSEFLKTKVRTQHAFQVRLLLRAVDRTLEKPGSGPLTIADIGDSSGTHLLYLRGLLKDDPRLAGRGFESLSVNLDPAAVERIRSKGLKAVLCPAEKLLEQEGIRADLYVLLETLEHLHDPTSFLDSLSRRPGAEWLAATVPYVRQSRVGLHHIRGGQERPVTPENTHIFELSPDDWKLLFRHAGWEVADEEIYLQYPKFSVWRALKPLWRRMDFEGFYGVVLRKNRAWAQRYEAGKPPFSSCAQGIADNPG